MGLREIDNIRLLLLIPVWIDGLLEGTCPQPSIRKEVKKIGLLRIICGFDSAPTTASCFATVI